MKRNRKWKIPYTVFEGWTLSIRSYKNCELKAKLMSSSSRKKKRVHFLQRLFFPKYFFFSIWVLTQCITYWRNFQDIYIYISLHIKKHFFMHFCCLFLKSSKAFSVSLIRGSRIVDMFWKVWIKTGVKKKGV